MAAGATYDVGRIEATMDLDLSPFQAGLDEAKREAARAKGEIDGLLHAKADLSADDRQLRSTVAEDEALLAALGSRTVSPQVDLVLRGLADVQAVLQALASEVLRPTVDVNMNGAAATQTVLDTFSRALRPPVDPDLAGVAKAQAALDALGLEVLRPKIIPDVVMPPFLGGGGTFGTPPVPIGDGGGGSPILPPVVGGGGGGGGAAAAGGGALVTFLHVSHLFMPELIGLAAALFSVATGFTVLGLAAASSVSDIMTGANAVDSAQTAIDAAIPGTTQWSQGVGQLGQAWSQIPTALQPAVAAIQRIRNQGGAMTTEIQGWLGAQAQWFAGALSKGGNVFGPLIVATEAAINTVEGMFNKSIGSGGLTRFVASMSRMIGPALVELVQLGAAIGRIFAGFAKAVTDGQGMETLVQIFRSIGDAVNSIFFQTFIAGWVDFDRILSDLLGGLGRLFALLSSVNGNLGGVAVTLGFVASAFLTLKSATFVMGKLGANTTTFSTALSGMLTKTVGVGLLAAGITGLVGNITSMLGVSDPLQSMWTKVGTALGFVSKKGGAAVDTINGYRVSLSGAIPVTGTLSDAMDLLVRSEQSIGGDLGKMASAFQKWNLSAVGASGHAQNAAAAFSGVQTAVKKATDSVASLVGTLQAKNGDLATWAADAQILIKRGMDPAAVASLAQTAPQDLASMATATTAQLKQMNVQWAEQMMLAKLSGQNGVTGLITAIEGGLTSGSPVLVAAAKALATSLGSTLKVPFTGSLASVQQIGVALNQLPASVVATLGGQTHQYSQAINDATVNTKKAVVPTQSWTAKLLSVGTNLGMAFLGLKLFAQGLDLMKVATLGLEGVAIIALLLGVYLLMKHFGVLPGLMIAGAAAVGILTVALIALDTVPIVALIAAIGLAIVGLVAALIYVAKHWKTIIGSIERTLGRFAAYVLRDVVAKIVGFFLQMVIDVEGAIAKAFSWVPGLGGKLQKGVDAVKTMKVNINTQFLQMAADALDAGTKIPTSLNSGITNGTPESINAATRLAAGVHAPLAKMPADAGTQAHNTVSGLASILAAGAAPAGAAGSSIGNSFGIGFANGIAAQGPNVAARAAQIAHSASLAAKLAQESRSPSRVMMRVGKDFGLGYALGITSATPAVKSAVTGMVTYTRNAFNGATQSVGAMQKAMGALISAVRAAGGSASALNALTTSEAQLTAAMTAQTTVTNQLADAKSKLIGLEQQYAQQVASTAQAVASASDIGSLGAAQTAATPSTVTLANIIAQYQAKANADTVFLQQIQQLQNEGLSKSIVQQLIADGPGQSAAQVAALAQATAAQISQINDTNIGIQNAGTGLGRLSASSMYSSGITAAQKLISGLESQQAALQKTIKTLSAGVLTLDPKKMQQQGMAAAQGLISGLKTQQGALDGALIALGQGMLAAFKSVFKIHSPSQVFADEIGMPIGQGIAVGITRSGSHVNSALGGLFGGHGGLSVNMGRSGPVSQDTGDVTEAIYALVASMERLPNQVALLRRSGALV